MNQEKTTHWVLPIIVALIGGFMSILDSSIVNVAIPKMMEVFGTDADQIKSPYTCLRWAWSFPSAAGPGINSASSECISSP